MEIISPPASVYVVDLDVGFKSGDVRVFTLYPADTLIETEAALTIHFAEPEELVVIYKDALAWTSRRTRLVELPITPPAPITELVAS
jgi:hypothetical protein